MSLCVDGSGRYCQCQPDDGQPCTEIERLRARVAALEAENAELRKDAERYRWLVKHWDFCAPDRVDACIDAAREGEK
jgi:hypothetical protein